jgi:hypothetical protein
VGHKQHTARLPTSLKQGPCGAAGFQGEISDQTALAALDSCAHMLGRRFDPKQGGFGNAPKFPRPAEINALLHNHLRSDSTDPGRWRLLTCYLALYPIRAMPLSEACSTDALNSVETMLFAAHVHTSQPAMCAL